MKKILAIASALTLLGAAVLVVPASTFAGSSSWCGKKTTSFFGGWFGKNKQASPVVNHVTEDNDVVVVSVDNDADVDSTTLSVAMTGGNKQSWNDDNNGLVTGPAMATANSTNIVNTTSVDINVD